jgi:hypothetical protein
MAKKEETTQDQAAASTTTTTQSPSPSTAPSPATTESSNTVAKASTPKPEPKASTQPQAPAAKKAKKVFEIAHGMMLINGQRRTVGGRVDSDELGQSEISQYLSDGTLRAV